MRSRYPAPAGASATTADGTRPTSARSRRAARPSPPSYTNFPPRSRSTRIRVSTDPKGGLFPGTPPDHIPYPDPKSHPFVITKVGPSNLVKPRRVKLIRIHRPITVRPLIAPSSPLILQQWRSTVIVRRINAKIGSVAQIWVVMVA